MAQKPTPIRPSVKVDTTVENTVVSPEKLAAWAHVREVWKATGRIPHVTQDVLDAEYEAANTD